jgi:hypothetical protein
MRKPAAALAVSRGHRADGIAIPAFRPPLSPPRGMPAGRAGGATSPGKAQLQAVRALGKPQQQAQQQPAQQQEEEAPEGTPGYSESSSVGRAVNAQIASSIAGMFMATPPQPSGFCSGGDDGSGSAGGSRPHGATQPVGAAAGNAADAGASGQADDGWVSPEPAQQFTISPHGFGGLPAPPEQPDRLQTAMSDSISLEPQVGRWEGRQAGACSSVLSVACLWGLPSFQGA